MPSDKETRRDDNKDIFDVHEKQTQVIIKNNRIRRNCERNEFNKMDVEFLRYQFQDGFSGVITKYGLSIGVRHIQMAYMFVSAVTMGVIRGGVGMAVLAMTVRHEEHTTLTIHSWDQRIQGAILSSFLFGYAVLLIPSELYLHKLSEKYVVTTMLAVNGLLSVALPTIANRGGWVAVCNAMLFMGMAQSGFSSINQSMLDKWLPPNEKKLFSFLIYGGIHYGILIALPVSSLLYKQPLGWELIVYSIAMLTLSVGVTYGILTASSPYQHQAIGDKEKKFIEDALMYYRKRSISKPWRQILTSPQFWAVVGAHSASNALFVFYLTNVPAVLKSTMPLEYVGIRAMLPFLAMWLTYELTSPTLGWLSNLRIVSYLLHVTNFRKLVNGLGAVGVITGLIVSSVYGTTLCHTITLASLGWQFSGFLSSYSDMSENFAGSLMMVGCAVSSLVGAAVPFLSGLLLAHPAVPTQADWRPVYLYLACLYLVCNVGYTVLAANTRQHWDKMAKLHTGHYNGMMDVNQMQLEEFQGTNYVQEKNELETAC